MSTLRVNTLQDAAGTGQPAMAGAAKAWVNFNGSGTVAIRAAFNVSSITDNGTGDYTINFTAALVDVNYSAHIQRGGGTQTGSGGTGVGTDVPSSLTTVAAESLRIGCFTYVGSTNGRSRADDSTINVAIFR